MGRFLMYYFGILFGLKALGLFEDEEERENEDGIDEEENEEDDGDGWTEI